MALLAQIMNVLLTIVIIVNTVLIHLAHKKTNYKYLFYFKIGLSFLVLAVFEQSFPPVPYIMAIINLLQIIPNKTVHIGLDTAHKGKIILPKIIFLIVVGH